MATVFDVAKYILEHEGHMTSMKLQKLCYYSHAWHLVWDEEPLFSERIEAWANGPVVRDLYRAHRGRFSVGPSDVTGDPDQLTASQRESVDVVLQHYGPHSAHDLSELTHRERPWADARRGMELGERGSVEITDDALFEFYDGLTSQEA
jgi:uncharacterized phage-associated protein